MMTPEQASEVLAKLAAGVDPQALDLGNRLREQLLAKAEASRASHADNFTLGGGLLGGLGALGLAAAGKGRLTRGLKLNTTPSIADKARLGLEATQRGGKVNPWSLLKARGRAGLKDMRASVPISTLPGDTASKGSLYGVLGGAGALGGATAAQVPSAITAPSIPDSLRTPITDAAGLDAFTSGLPKLGTSAMGLNPALAVTMKDSAKPKAKPKPKPGVVTDPKSTPRPGIMGKAAGEMDVIADAARLAKANLVKREVLKDALNAGLLALGGGVAARGIYGLLRDPQRDIPGLGTSVEMRLPYPVKPKDMPTRVRQLPQPAIGYQEGKTAGAMLIPGATPPPKPLAGPMATGGSVLGGLGGAGVAGIMALLSSRGRRGRGPSFGLPAALAGGVSGAAAGGGAGHTLGTVIDKTKSPLEAALGKTGSTLGSVFSGDRATTWDAVPWSGPLFTAAAGLGAYGGWKGMDAIMNKRQESQRRDELENARAEFEKALLDSYDSPIEIASPIRKAAQLASEAYELVMASKTAAEKTAILGLDMENTAGTATNAYATYALLSGLLGGSMVYGAAKKRNPSEVMESALRKRREERHARRPLELTAVPEPIPTSGGPSFRSQMKELSLS